MTSNTTENSPVASPLATGESFPISRGKFAGLSLIYIFGILLGVGFVALWATGMAEMGLGLAGIAIAGVCLYLLPESLKPAAAGEALILGEDRLQYVRGGNDVIGQVPYGNIAAVVLNPADGHQSLWVLLGDATASDTWWPGGKDSMETIFAQCGHHLVVGKHLQVSAKALLDKIQAKLAA